MKKSRSKLLHMGPSAGIPASEISAMDFQEEIAMAVDTDELIDFIVHSGREARMLIRRMSIEAAQHFGLTSNTVGDMSYLYHRGFWNPENDPATAEIASWVWNLARRNRIIYFVRIGLEPEDFEEIRLDKYGTLGIDLKKSVYFRAA